MAELDSRDVVNKTLSAGDLSPSDAAVTTSHPQSRQGDEEEEEEEEEIVEAEIFTGKENGFHISTHSPPRSDDQNLEDATARSDTDTSRADGSSIGDGKSAEPKAIKKFTVSKPISFAKYSVPKVVAANAAKTTPDKALPSNIVASSAPAVGKPRLVAKTTSSLQQKGKPFKQSAPDPMQVWNKNRITPQPSTKHLTDEELKQQYGIHLTSRLQSDGEGKEAKWADIDDDEDDWAPETIEWGDGTKTTVNPADAPPAPKSATTSKPSTPVNEVLLKPTLDTKPTFQASIGPNATVLKVGASVERQQQAQRAAQLQRGPVEKPPLHSSQTNPAPPPPKSPWAAIPAVDKVSPIEISPQAPSQSSNRHTPNGSYVQQSPYTNSVPAQEISADDFSRTWRDPSAPQARELFMPSSGRYEAVNESRRRQSRNDQGFRAPAVLQRPGQGDPRAPEPSAAFQTNRTSSDVMRRRASSTVSGGSGQLARRMSVKSGEVPAIAVEDEPPFVQAPVQSDLVSRTTPPVPPQLTQPSAYQAMNGASVNGSTAGQTDAELQAQRAQQKERMKEQAESARKRRMEEEARLEAEKQERIRQKLLALGPDPKAAKAEEEAKAKAKAETDAKERPTVNAEDKAGSGKPAPAQAPSRVPPVSAPPKPPQPLASGEPQQYGEMKVYPSETAKKPSPSGVAATKPLHHPQSLPPTFEDANPEPPEISGGRSVSDAQRHSADASVIPDPIPRNRPVGGVADARVGWGRNDHRSPVTNNLWGAPHNKALGNGTFDQTLAGYAPQNLSSRASSTGQGYINGRTPTVGQSPQLAQATQHVPETRSQALQNLTSPEPQPLAVDSEIDSMQPVRPVAPIGPPQTLPPVQDQMPQPVQPLTNGFRSAPNSAAVAGWNNFHNVARSQERADTERIDREVAERREHEKRTGLPAQANYDFSETFKQVQLGDHPSHRQVSNVVQNHMPPSSMFGAVGSLLPPPPPLPASGPQAGRGSRFFPPQNTFTRLMTYVYPEAPRSPSPPPAEEYLCPHPLYEEPSYRPVIRFPPTKAVVRLPPAKPPTPRAPTPPPTSAETPTASQSQMPLTWAARVSMPAPKPAAPMRSGSTPIVQTPSWQERFNGLLGRKTAEPRSNSKSAQGSSQPALAVTSASKEPLDVMHSAGSSAAAAVSLPHSRTVGGNVADAESDGFITKEVETEEDLFEDREAGSLPTIYLPEEAPHIKWPRPTPHRVMPTPPDSQTAFIFLGSHWKEDKFPKQHFAIIRVPGNDKSIKKDLPFCSATPPVSTSRPSPVRSSGPPFRRGRGTRGRGTSTARAH